MADGDSRPGSAQRTRRVQSLRAGSRKPSGLDIDVLLPTGMRAPGLARWLQSVAPARARGRVSVAVVPDARVRVLNHVYRKTDANTDVLSFPAEAVGDRGADLVRPAPRRPEAAARLAEMKREAGSPAFLGDIVIAAGVARRQAREAGHSLQTELRILALHGLLHLLGYDHEQDSGQMGRLERRLRRQGGLQEGLIERAAAPSERPVAPARRR